jgi:multisubunit Na+/H+ antiporter MnhG subunit
MPRNIVIDVLLTAAVLVVLASALGVLVMRDVYQKVHYVTPAALIAPLLIGLAILVESGWSVNSSLIWLALLFVVAGGPFLSHAMARSR